MSTATVMQKTKDEIERLEAERRTHTERHTAARRRAIDLVQQRAQALTDAALNKRPVGLKAIDDQIKAAEAEADNLSTVCEELTARIDGLRADLSKSEFADLITAWPALVARHNEAVKTAVYLRGQLVLAIAKANDLYREGSAARSRIDDLSRATGQSNDVINQHRLIMVQEMTGRRPVTALGVSEKIISDATLADGGRWLNLRENIKLNEVKNGQ